MFRGFRFESSPQFRKTLSVRLSVTPKVAAAQFVEAGGLRPIDVGPLSRAQQPEGIGPLNVAVQFARGTNFGSALKIIS